MSAGADALPAQTRTWRRFTPAQRAARFSVYIVIVAAIVASARSVEVIPEFLYDAPEQMQDLFRRMWPIAFYHYAGGVHDALMDTLHIASLGTILAVAMAVPIGLLAANNVTPNKAVNYFAKLLLVSSRSVNSLVWALLFVAIFGPGALAGTLAIAFRSIGFVGKLVGEALARREAPPGARFHVREGGVHSSSASLPRSRNTPRTQVASSSPTKMSAMIDSRIAATKS